MSNDLVNIMACEFRHRVDQDSVECIRCRRVIMSTMIRDIGNSLLVQVCGVPGSFDSTYPNGTPNYLYRERSRYHFMDSKPPRIPQTNELIGQEGGRFDAMYLEET